MYLPWFNDVLMCLYGSSCHVTLLFTVERLRDQLVDSKNRVSNRLNSLDDAVLEELTDYKDRLRSEIPEGLS